MKSLKSLILNQFFFLGIIILVGFGLRTYRLSEIPVGFHIDEAQVGYNAYSLLKTGKDELGNFLPIHLPIWGYERPMSIFYLTIPGILFFGLNETGTRLPTVVLGTLTIILVYYFAGILFNNKKLALLSSFLFALSPWHIILSRATSEAVVSLFFYLAGTILFFKYHETDKNKFILALIGYLFYIVSFFSYHSTRLAIPVILLFFFIFSFKENKQKSKIFLLFLLFYLIFPLALFYKTSIGRFNQTSVFHEPGTQLILEEQIREDGSNYPYLLTRFVHNKLVNYSLRLTQNISSYFSYDFLLFKGGAPVRYIVPNMGLIYFLEFPFLLWGVILFFRKSFLEVSIKNKIFIALWIFLGVFSSSLTNEETPNIQRALFTLPMLQLIIAFGFLDLFLKINSKLLKNIGIFIIFVFFIFNVYYFFHQYNVHTFSHRPWNRQYEMKELVYFLNSVKDHYKKVVLTFNSTEPYIFFLFFNKTDPKTVQKIIAEKGLDYFWNNIEGIEISRKDCPGITKKEKDPNTLVVYKIQCLFPLGSRVVKKIKYSDGETSLVAVDFPINYKLRDKDIKYED